MRNVLLLLVTLSGLAFAEDIGYGTVVSRDSSSLVIKNPQGEKESYSVRASVQIPAWVAPGKRVQVTYQELRIAVKMPNGQRGCQQAFEVQSVAPWDGKLTAPTVPGK